MWGAPSAGKSTAAAGLFYKMKSAGYNVELISEYAKDLVWEGRTYLMKDQLYLLAKQNRKLERLRHKVDWCITDSPILLVLAYMPEDYYEGFEHLTSSIWKSYDNVNFLINRHHDFEQNGRAHTQEQSSAIDQKILEIFAKYSVDYAPVNSYDAVDDIFDIIARVKKAHT